MIEEGYGYANLLIMMNYAYGSIFISIYNASNTANSIPIPNSILHFYISLAICMTTSEACEHMRSVHIMFYVHNNMYVFTYYYATLEAVPEHRPQRQIQIQSYRHLRPVRILELVTHRHQPTHYSTTDTIAAALFQMRQRTP